MIRLGLGEIGLAQDLASVPLDRPFGHPQLGCDAGVRTLFSHEGEDLALAAGQERERIILTPSTHSSITRIGSTTDTAFAIRSTVSMNSSTSVTRLLRGTRSAPRWRAARSHAPRPHGPTGPGCRFGELVANHACRIQALGRVRRRHPDVHGDEVGVRRRTSDTSCSPSPARPRISNPDRSSGVATPSRTRTSSSAIRTPHGSSRALEQWSRSKDRLHPDDNRRVLDPGRCTCEPIPVLRRFWTFDALPRPDVLFAIASRGATQNGYGVPRTPHLGSPGTRAARRAADKLCLAIRFTL